MIWSAHIKVGSLTDVSLRKRKVKTCTISGAVFRLRGGKFCSGELQDYQIVLLRDDPEIALEAAAVRTPPLEGACHAR